MTVTTTALRNEVHKLAEEAFHRNLISGYGDGEYGDEYQIVVQGKPRHLPLTHARLFLSNLIRQPHQRNYSDRLLLLISSPLASVVYTLVVQKLFFPSHLHKKPTCTPASQMQSMQPDTILPLPQTESFFCPLNQISVSKSTVWRFHKVRLLCFLKIEDLKTGDSYD